MRSRTTQQTSLAPRSLSENTFRDGGPAVELAGCLLQALNPNTPCTFVGHFPTALPVDLGANQCGATIYTSGSHTAYWYLPPLTASIVDGNKTLTLGPTPTHWGEVPSADVDASGGNAACNPPTAHFAMSGQGQSAYDGNTLYVSSLDGGPVTVSVDAGSSSTSGNALISTYAWTVGGVSIGTGSSASTDVGVGSTAVSLTITDSYGMTASTSGTVTVAYDQCDANLESGPSDVDCGSSESGGGTYGGGSYCSPEWIEIDISYDGGATWDVWWEGEAEVCSDSRAE